MPESASRGDLPGPRGVPGSGGSWGVPGHGRYLPGPGGCTWSQGCNWFWGQCTWSWGGVTGPWGCTWSQGSVPGLGVWGYLVPGVYLVLGVYLVRYYPPVDRMTHTYENITLPQTSFAGGNESNKFWLGFTTVLSYEITSRFTGLKGIQIFILPHYKTKKRRQCGSHSKNANPYSL